MDITPKIPNWSAQDLGRVLVTFALVGMFCFALVHEMVAGTDAQTKNLLIGALIGAFSTGAVQFWFGTSPQSAAKDETIAKMADNTQAALVSTPPADKP
jgi:hypothetical protein